MVLLTIAARNYTAQALTLIESVRAYSSGVIAALCVPERVFKIPSVLKEAFDHVFFVEELTYKDLDLFMFCHNMIEGATAIKARALLYLLERFPGETCFLFLDPDMLTFCDLSTLFKPGKSGIILTPHLLQDELDPQRMGTPFFRVLNGGIFNLGMIGIRRSPSSIQFLRWWDSILEHLCFAEADRGIFFDQKWVDFALGFTDPEIVRDPGYNIAWWNLRARWIEKIGDSLVTNGTPVKLIHFSGMTDPAAILNNLKHIDEDHLIYDIATQYNNRLLAFGRKEYVRYDWSFGRFSSGEEISHSVRVSFRRLLKLQRDFPTPYLSSNAAISSAISKSTTLT